MLSILKYIVDDIHFQMMVSSADSLKGLKRYSLKYLSSGIAPGK